MSIDDELRQALAESETAAVKANDGDDSDPVSPVEAHVSAPALRRGDEDAGSGNKRNLGLVIGLLAVSAAVLFFVFNGLEGATYAKTVGEVLSAKTELESRKLRVQGILVHGTLQKRDQPCEFRFKMRTMGQADSAPLDVRYESCIVPDTFRDVKGMDVEVTAEGKLAEGGSYLAASQIFAKCPSKYEMQQRQAAGEIAPHGPGKPQVNPIDTIGKYGQGS